MITLLHRAETLTRVTGTRKPLGRVPRVARLLGLARRFERLIETGFAGDYADLARLGQVTRARVNQVMNLLVLAPDSQEAILFLPSVTSGKDPVSEQGLREVVAEQEWERQRSSYFSTLRSMPPTRPRSDGNSRL